ncbi:MAG TPA: GNAT family N-acetyltransferase [Clostridia bacterium]|nr:GNAT family N-acetyltransferase [Clostridia bacterium]
MLKKLNAEDFDEVYSLMEKSFPKDEYRSYKEQKELLSNPIYSIYALQGDGGSVKAFIAVWEFNEFLFIEHLAVNPEYRNSGIGTRMLSEIAALFNKTACLEVEPPETELSCRRIGFYERNNFFFNEYPYIQPAISKGRKPVTLFIMTSGGTVDEKMWRQIKNTLYSKVYKCSASHI